jgi:hypothetical protein
LAPKFCAADFRFQPVSNPSLAADLGSFVQIALSSRAPFPGAEDHPGHPFHTLRLSLTHAMMRRRQARCAARRSVLGQSCQDVWDYRKSALRVALRAVKEAVGVGNRASCHPEVL